MKNKIYICIKPIMLSDHPASKVELGEKIVITSSYKLVVGTMHRFRRVKHPEVCEHLDNVYLNIYFKPISDVTEALYG